MKKNILIIIFISVATIAFAQNKKLDSLLGSFKQNSINDTNKVKTGNLIAWEYFITGDYKESQKYADQSILLSEKLNFLKGKAEAINYLGNIHAQKYHDLYYW